MALVQVVVLLINPMMTRESPMLTPVMVFPLIIAMESVVPLNSVVGSALAAAVNSVLATMVDSAYCYIFIMATRERER